MKQQLSPCSWKLSELSFGTSFRHYFHPGKPQNRETRAHPPSKLAFSSKWVALNGKYGQTSRLIREQLSPCSWKLSELSFGTSFRHYFHPGEPKNRETRAHPPSKWPFSSKWVALNGKYGQTSRLIREQLSPCNWKLSELSFGTSFRHYFHPGEPKNPEMRAHPPYQMTIFYPRGCFKRKIRPNLSLYEATIVII